MSVSEENAKGKRINGNRKCINVKGTHKTVDPKFPGTGFGAKIRLLSTHTSIESARCGLFIDGII